MIPDFIANCGMARVFAYFMKAEAQMTDEAIFKDVSRTIRRALQETRAANPQPAKLSATALELALHKLIAQTVAA